MKKIALALFAALAGCILLASCSENSGPAASEDLSAPEELKTAPEFDLEKLDGTFLKSAAQ